jgi:predicted RecA/RadA family phage recombinase
MVFNIPKMSGRKLKEVVKAYLGSKTQDLKKDKQDDENRIMWNNECW